MIIFPAVDMRRGKCVRLVQGRAEAETVYSEDPLVVARRWCDQGATWLHLVDLDGAMVQGSHNRTIAREIFEALPIPVQFGGGVRTLSDIRELLEAGATRVILGTVAVERPDLVEEALTRHPGQVIVGLDARQGRVATRGWNQLEALEALPFARDLARRGVGRIVYTDIGKDGTLRGPNLEATGQMARESGLKVIASGGVSSLRGPVAAQAPGVKRRGGCDRGESPLRREVFPGSGAVCGGGLAGALGTAVAYATGQVNQEGP